MDNSIPSRLCIYCKIEKPWIFSGKKLKDGSKIYTNEFAVRWAGRRCPDCERTRVHAAVRCGGFERDLIIKQLEQSGFVIQSKTLPIKAEKNGKVYSVGIRHAHAESSGLTLNKAPKEQADLYALVFSSVRICTADQLANLEPSAKVYKPSRKPQPSEQNKDSLEELGM
ncbi:MAG: hypothetical protein AB8G05_11920 [Oligoflexales bacterium]